MYRVLLTGHKGYIGSHMLARLLDEGYSVTTITGEILDADENELKQGQYDYIIHLAALAGVRASLDNPDLYLKNNVETTRMMFRIAEATKTAILYASSSNAKMWHLNPYATTKKINELDATQYKIRSVGMRFHTVWPGRPDMLYQRLKKKNVMYINENHTRDFIHIEDLCNALFTIMENFGIITLDQPNVVHDIGTGHATPVAEVAKRMGFTGQYRTDPTPHERSATRADVEWLHTLGWGPKRNIINS
jgi:nucleoside-diphosphate-sugar epimerase